MIYQKFIDLLKLTKPTSYQLPAAKAKYWFDSYFKYYEVKELQKVFSFMEEQGMDFNLHIIFSVIEEFYGVLLHQEVKKAYVLLNKAKKQNIKLTDNPPDLGLPIPVKQIGRASCRERV